MAFVAVACVTASTTATDTNGAKSTTASACINFGCAAAFNAVVFSDYDKTTSDTEGKLAVGGNAILGDGTQGYSVGDKLGLAPSSCNVDVAIFAGNIEWKGGRAHFGNIAVGGEAKLAKGTLENGCRVNKYTTDMFDFSKAKTELDTIAKQLAALPSTVVSQDIKNTGLTLTLNGKNGVNVVNIDDPNFFMGKVRKFDAINGADAGSIIIFNIKGAQTGATTIDTELLKNYQAVFNFYEATCLTFEFLSLHASVIATNADVKGANGGLAKGELKGQIFVKSITGPIQLSHKPLTCPQTAGVKEITCRIRPTY